MAKMVGKITPYFILPRKVSSLEMVVNPAKTAEPIEMPFRMWT